MNRVRMSTIARSVNLTDARGVMPTILFQDNHIMVVDKPATMLSQNDTTSDVSLLNFIKVLIARESNKVGEAYVGLVHRLDRPCSGVMVFAKTSKAAARLSENFRNQGVDKKYLCVVNGELKGQDNCSHNIVKSSGVGFNNKTTILHSNSSTANVTETSLSYRSIVCFDGPQRNKEDADRPHHFRQSLVDVTLETGRKHQIRASMAAIGHPICGDVKYGAVQRFKERDIALHAYSLTIPHPITSDKMTFKSLPPEIWRNRFGNTCFEAIELLVNKNPNR